MDQTISGIVVGVVTGVASSVISILVFRTQRRWERKEDAYKEVLEALHEMKAASSIEYNAAIEMRDLSSERVEIIYKRWFAGRAVVDRYADIGSVVLSTEAEDVLSTLKRELEKSYDTSFERADNDNHNVGIALAALKALAIKEQHKSPFIWRRTPEWIRALDGAMNLL